MNDQQINAVIAEACGWTDIGECTCGFKLRGYPPEYSAHGKHIPNYCGCLNAMHEAESSLTDDQYVHFSDYLYNAERERQKQTKKWRWLSATARQRADAFLRAIGRWKATVNTIDQNVIVCPHCGYHHDDSHESGQYGRDMNDEGIDDCTMCRELIQWSRTVITLYTTEKVTTEECSEDQKEVQP